MSNIKQSRIIKFRAWDKATNRILETGFHILGEVTCFGIIEQKLMEQPMGKTTLERIGDVEIMQFTGLQDKNGKDIYESDIVRKDSYSIGYCEPIVWRDCMFQVGNTGICPLYDANGYEVIGNIYENKNLLP